MLIKVAETEAEKLACLPVMRELRTHLNEADFLPQLLRQEALGYRLASVAVSGKVVAVGGFWINEAFAYGKYMYVYDLVTREGARSGGHGKALLDFLKEHALAAGCTQLHLDSGVQRFEAHRFYLREGFRISAHHFALDLG